MCWPPIGWSFTRGKSQIVAFAGWSLMRGRLYSVVSEETVVKSRWSLIRVVVHVEFHGTYNIFVTFPIYHGYTQKTQSEKIVDLN